MSIESGKAEPIKPANSDDGQGSPNSAKARVIQFARFAQSARSRIDVPRLNISDNTERNTFVAALVGGGAIIWLGEFFDLVDTYGALFVATASIAGYGILCFCGREQRIRLDRAGDNCYYLGLVYTLMSLSVALVKREIGTSPDALIQTFGIAVGSTIVGVIARLLLIQYRMEPDDIEARARVELAAAADELKRQLIDAASRFQTFAVSIQDSVRTAVTTVTDDQINRQKELVEQINGVLTKSIEAITQSTTVIEGSLKKHSSVMEKYQSAAEKSAGAADALASKIEALAVPDDLISKGFTALQESLANTVSRLDSATQALGKSSGEFSSAATNLSQLAAQSGHVSSAMDGSFKSITSLKNAVEGMTAAVSAETARLSGGNKALDDEVTRMKQLTLDYAKGLSDVAQFLAKEIGRARK